MANIFEGKVALVTGGNAGIGQAVALAFAREGARVVVAARREEQGQAVVAQVRRLGGDALFVRTDVTRAAEVQAMVEQTIATYGRLDYACNNAGLNGPFAPVTEQHEDDWDRVVDTNLKGTWLCMKYEIPYLLKQHGAIVNVASALGLVAAGVGMAPYIASKHGVVGLTKAAALEYAAQGLRVNAVCPFNIRTSIIESYTGGTAEGEAMLAQMHPLGRIGTPEEVAEAVVWLCSERSAFSTGLALPLDGGALAQ